MKWYLLYGIVGGIISFIALFVFQTPQLPTALVCTIVAVLAAGWQNRRP